MPLALSIKQPWAWLILNRNKDIENREWATKFRGEFYIHTGKKMDVDAYDEYYALCAIPYKDDMPLEALVGKATIIDCVNKHDSKWFFGPWGFIMSDVVALPKPIPLRGKLGFFKFDERILK